MKVLVTGGRYWDDYETIQKELEMMPPGTTVIHGACKGADMIADEIAKELGYTVRAYPADWSSHGRSAGPIRNRQMLREEHLAGEPIDLVLAFHENINESRGTKDMLKIAKDAGVQTRVVTG